MRKSVIIALTAILLAMPVIGISQTQKPYSMPVPKDGFVPNASTATAIAEAVWIPIYGHETILGERPLKATLQGDKWIVNGTLKKGYVGGVATIEISKTNGQILRVSHGK